MKKWILLIASIFTLFLLFSSFDDEDLLNANGSISYFGRSSIKIKTFDGFVIYIDPYAPGDYTELAGLILVTHGHSDHNKISLVSKNEKTYIIAPINSINGMYTIAKDNQIYEFKNIKIEIINAYNKNHPKGSGFGYIIIFGNFKFYHAGDTNLIEEMNHLSTKNITIAALPCDGFYNMDPATASSAAKIIKPKYLMPIHSDPHGLYNETNIRLLDFENILILKPGQTILIKDLNY